METESEISVGKSIGGMIWILRILRR